MIVSEVDPKWTGMATQNSFKTRMMSLAVLLAAQHQWEPEVLKQAVALVNEAMHAMDTNKAERENFRALLAEWEEGVYDGHDFLRRVKLALNIGKPVVTLASLRGMNRKP